jgi:pimeloyl-ACP methyl ester carboxylesterase
MPTATVNSVRLFYTLSGDGPPLVLIHGSWGDHVSWDLVVPALAQRFRVLTYDRRGHSQSQRPSTQGSTEEDVDDLVALIEHLGLAPAHVAGTSSGASLALRLAARHPELVRSVAAHEPGLFGLFVDDPNQGTLMREALGRLEAAATRLAAGDVEGGTRQFMETVVFGPRAWEIIPPERRQVLMSNAPTVRDEMRDPGSWTADLAALAAISCPILLTYGGESFPFWQHVVAQLAAVLPHAQMQVIAGAGHNAHVTHPEAYVAAITAFLAAGDMAATAGEV